MKTLTANLLPLTAPFAGVVINRNMVIGELTSTATPQFVLADISQLWVMVDVRREDANRLARDQEVLFVPDGAREDRNEEAGLYASTLSLLSAGCLPTALSLLPERVEFAVGKVDWISSEVDEKTRTVRVRAVIPNQQHRLRPHTFGNGWITIRSSPAALVVPNTAIQADGPYQFVFVQRDAQTFEPRLVQTGIKDDKFTEILSGVSMGEKVVTTGSYVLKSEMFRDRLGGGDD